MKLLLLLTLAAASVLSAPAQEKKPIASLTVSYTYLYSDQGGYRINLSGWNLRPAVPIGRGYTLFFSNANYYGGNRKGSVNSHSFTLGLAKSVFAMPHFKPTIFLESGDVRSSNAGAITHQALVATGASVSIPLRPWVSLMVLPAEYVFKYPHADWRNDINSKIGLTFPIGHH